MVGQCAGKGEGERCEGMLMEGEEKAGDEWVEGGRRGKGRKGRKGGREGKQEFVVQVFFVAKLCDLILCFFYSILLCWIGVGIYYIGVGFYRVGVGF